jgi:hypothetical protein
VIVFGEQALLVGELERNGSLLVVAERPVHRRKIHEVAETRIQRYQPFDDRDRGLVILLEKMNSEHELEPGLFRFVRDLDRSRRRYQRVRIALLLVVGKRE